MKRIYSNYPEYEYEGIAAEAEKRGLSLSAFQRYCVMVCMAKETPGFDAVSGGFYDSISMRLNDIKPGETFTVADLFPNEWPGFDKSRKMMMAKRLAGFVKNNPHAYSVHESEPGRSVCYVKAPARDRMAEPNGGSFGKTVTWADLINNSTKRR